MWFFVALLTPVVGWLIYMLVTFNQLVESRNFVSNSFAQVDVQLKCRQNLVTNLIELVAEYVSEQPKEINNILQIKKEVCQLQQLAEHRPDNLQHLQLYATAQYALTKELIQCNYVLGNYPTLSSDKRLDELRDRLANVEKRIFYASQNYNTAVDTFNDDRVRPVNKLLNGVLKLGYAQVGRFEMGVDGGDSVEKSQLNGKSLKTHQNYVISEAKNDEQGSQFLEELRVV